MLVHLKPNRAPQSTLQQMEGPRSLVGYARHTAASECEETDSAPCTSVAG